MRLIDELAAAVKARCPSVLAGAFLLIYLPLIGLVPYLVPVDPTLASASSLLGYSNSTAYGLFVGWSLLGMLVVALLARRGGAGLGARPGPAPDSLELAGSEWHFRWWEVAAVSLVTLALFWPPFLARSGPAFESVYFLNTLHRLQSGMLPYRDFEFSYGPLMLGMLQAWANVFGSSMLSYFWLFAVSEALQAALLMAGLQWAVPEARLRVKVLIVLALQLFNVSLGLNTSGGRILLPIAAVLAIARWPNRLDVLAAAGAILGLSTAFSHDVGAVSLIAGLGVIGLMFWRGDRSVYFWRAALLGTVTVAVWWATAALVLGELVPDYLAAAMHQVSRRGAGENAFPFHWTVQSASVFLIVGLVCLVVGRGLGASTGAPLSSGDRLLFAGLLFSLVAMKGGLARCDMAHLSRAILCLTVVLVLPAKRVLFDWSPLVDRTLRAALIVMVATTAAGWAPTTRGYLAAWLSGAAASATGPARVGETRAPSIELERARPDAATIELARYVAQPDRRLRPVLCYNDAWWLYMRIGAFSEVYPSDFVVLSDGEAIRYGQELRSRPDTIVVMRQAEYDRLFDAATRASAPSTSLQEWERIGRLMLTRISSVHFSYVPIEMEAVARRVDRTIGAEIRRSWRPVRTFGEFVVLEHRDVHVTGVLVGPVAPAGAVGGVV